MKKNIILGLVALMLVGIVAAGASAFRGHFGDSEDKEEMKQAIENNDFDAWKSLIEEKLTQENFDEIVQRHENRSLHRENKEAVKQAIDSNDYDAYLEAIKNIDDLPEDHETLSEDDFNKVVEMHEAMQEGDHETAKEIREELGDKLPGPKGPRGKGMQQGQGRGMRGPKNNFNLEGE